MMLVMNETMAMMATVAVATNACFSIILLFLKTTNYANISKLVLLMID
jgi:hypothetical protein